MGKFKKFLKDWSLPLAMVAGALAYAVYAAMPTPASLDRFVNDSIGVVQPSLLFLMLFLSFCKIDVTELKPCKWNIWLILIQAGSFIAMGVALWLLPDFPAKVLVEGAMIAMICPTATAAAVVTQKLGGSIAHVISYTILINLVVSIAVPAIVPLVRPQESMTFITAFFLILGKVFPLLILPFIAAMLVRHLTPHFHKWIMSFPDAAFYIWLVALSLAIAVTIRSIVHSSISVWYMVGLAAVSALCCALQFHYGRKIGAHYDDTVTAGQALGQKNTVFAIWMGYTFFDPVTAIVGGFYSVCHNLVTPGSFTATADKLPDASCHLQYWSSHAKNSRFQWMEFCGFRIQWFSSGKRIIFEGHPTIWAALKADIPCSTGTR